MFFILIAAFAGPNARAALSQASQSPSTQALPSADSIFAHHHAAMGRLPSLIAHWSGTIVDNGQTAKYDITAARDGRFRRTFTLTLTQLNDGSNLYLDWGQDENGNVQTSLAQRHQSMDSRLVRLNDLRFQSRGSVVTGMTTINGRKAYSVSIAMQGTSALVYFDVQSGLLDGCDIGSETIRYRSYRRFEGVAVPTDIVESGSDENLNITVDKVDFVAETRGEFDPRNNDAPPSHPGSPK